MSRSAGAGRQHSQAASPSWPMEIFYTIDVIISLWMEFGLGGRNLLYWFLFFLRVWTFLGVQSFFGSFAKFSKRATSGFHDHCLGTVYELFIRWWKICMCIVYLCIFITISISMSISFLVFLNCLCLNSRVPPFVHISSPSVWGGRGGVSEWLSSARLPG